MLTCNQKRNFVQVLTLLFVVLMFIVMQGEASLGLAVEKSASTPAKKITSIEGITEYRLANGLKILLFPDASKPTVTVNLTILVGSRHEGYGEAGMAHLLEHMLFKGTPTHQKIPQLLKERGARFNGTTWLDRTNYYETLPASEKNLEFAIHLEADRMMNSYVKNEDLQSEMTVVRNEFERGENSETNVLGQRMMSAAFEWHNYGKSTIGNRADIERVPIENLKNFYKKHYQPDNAVLVVAGKFDPEQALSFINKYFGKIPQPDSRLNNTYTEEPAQDGERIVTLRRVGDIALVGSIYHIPAGSHPDYVAIDVLESILTAKPAGRLYKGLVETRKASDVNGAAFSLHDPGVLRLLAEVNKGNDPQLVLESLVEISEKVGQSGVTKEELERAKLKLLKQWELTSTNSSRIAVQLSEWAAMGDWRLYFLYRDRLEKVSTEDVKRVAKTYLQQSNRTVGMFIPTKKPERATIPAAGDIAKMIGDYKGRALASSGEEFDVSPANIDQRTVFSQLSTGLKVAALEKKTRGNTVVLEMVLRFGSRESLKHKGRICKYIGPMLMRGTEDKSRQEIQDQLDKLQARLTIGSTAGELTASIYCKREQLTLVLKLLNELLRKPNFPAAEFVTLQQASLASLEQQLKNPQILATTAVRRKISPYPQGDPLYVPTVEEAIAETKAVSRDQVESLYQQQLNGTTGSVSIVGDFEAKEILPLLERMLSGWTSEQAYQRIRTKAVVREQGSVERILTPDKANAVYFAATTLPMRDNDADYASMVIGNSILGGSSLSSRLGDRVRQKEGLSYGVGSGFNASALDERAVFYIYASTNPQNIKKVDDAIREEVALLLNKGITQPELNRAKEGFLQQLQVQLSSDGQLAGLLNKNLQAKRNMQYVAGLTTAIEKLTAEDVLSVLKRRIQLEKFDIVEAGDFSKKSTSKPQTNE